jgi:hypothetical protein
MALSQPGLHTSAGAGRNKDAAWTLDPRIVHPPQSQCRAASKRGALANRGEHEFQFRVASGAIEHEFGSEVAMSARKTAREEAGDTWLWPSTTPSSAKVRATSRPHISGLDLWLSCVCGPSLDVSGRSPSRSRVFTKQTALPSAHHDPVNKISLFA